MGITLLAVGALAAPLHQLFGQWRLGLLRRAAPARMRAHPVPLAPRARVARAAPTVAGHARPLRPLRVVRMAEPFRAPASAGRMTISGRMADVCAELDRLAAVEAGALSLPKTARPQVAPPSR